MEKKTIFVKDYITNCLIGIYPKEKIKKQRVRFNIVVTAKDNIKNNNVISDFVSYEDIISIIKNKFSYTNFIKQNFFFNSFNTFFD